MELSEAERSRGPPVTFRRTRRLRVVNTEMEPDRACTVVPDMSGCRVRATPIDRIRRPFISSSGSPYLCDGLD
jgi:hypothetical protein